MRFAGFSFQNGKIVHESKNKRADARFCLKFGLLSIGILYMLILRAYAYMYIY